MARQFRTRGAWLLGATVLAAAVATQPASAVRTALGEPKVHPGVVLDTAGSDCTSNFVFADAENHLYIGQAAHCSSQGQDVNFDGCKEQSMPLGTQVTVVGADVSGTLAYNSWRTMQARHETNASACSDNDFALVRLPDAARSSVSPDVPYFGGPHGINTTGVEQGGMVYAYGNSPLRGGVGVLSPKRGVALSTIDDGWSYLTYFATPGIPGDSGSAVLDSDGHALGVMSSLITTPTPGANGVADIWRMFSYAHDLSGIKGLRLVDGAQPFTSGG
ncbi:MAG TPA: trypsin-like peptidase domain-containing protein [Sporichthyaceae bacterium]|nr:trypsin-like peptidase domain-containing protein [Sporichthyaceae bacterium]